MDNKVMQELYGSQLSEDIAESMCDMEKSYEEREGTVAEEELDIRGQVRVLGTYTSHL